MADLSDSETTFGTGNVSLVSQGSISLLQRRQIIGRPSGHFLPRSFHSSFALRTSASSDSQVFNLEWTKNGSQVIAALENGGVRFWDPLSPRMTKCIVRAHNNCTNIIRVADEHHFWTGSDDCTIKEWDLRRLDTHTRWFHGHKNWVKTIDLMGNGQLLTAAYDGTVRVWDMHEEYPEGNSADNHIFSNENLSRARFHGSTLALSVGNSLILVHDFDLETAKTLRHLDVKLLLKGRTKERGLVPREALSDFNRVELLRERYGGVGTVRLCSSSFIHLSIVGLTRLDRTIEALLVYDLQTTDDIEAALQEGQSLPMDAGGFRLPAALLPSALQSRLWPDRLLYHVTDSAAGRGFIKEPSISPCSQMIASPYYKGFRIFDLGGSVATESPDLLLHPPLLNTHAQPVLTCAFHPFSAMLGAGGLDGEVKFFAPSL